MDPCKDAFPTGMEVLKEGDPGLSAEYKALSKTLFGKVSHVNKTGCAKRPKR